MNKLLLMVVAVFMVVGCKTGGSSNVEPKVEAASAKMAVKMSSKGAIKVQSISAYAKNNKIRANIKDECKLDVKLPKFVQSFATSNGINVQLIDKVTSSTKGKALVIEIVDAVSQGNAFIGHRKFTKVKGTLYENGKMKAGFTGGRFSGGGFFGVYKGSCSVLGRTVKTIGKDVAGWLKNPVDGAELGDRL